MEIYNPPKSPFCKGGLQLPSLNLGKSTGLKASLEGSFAYGENFEA
jgi:hypothetical protein